MVITKIDMCPPNILQETLQSIKKLVKSIGCRKTPIIIKNEEDVSISVTNFASDRLCPIFQVSNVDGTNLNYLRMFLNLLNSRAPRYDRSPQEFQIDEIYSVPVYKISLVHIRFYFLSLFQGSGNSRFRIDFERYNLCQRCIIIRT